MQKKKMPNACEMLANYAEQLGTLKERERARKCLGSLISKSSTLYLKERERVRKCLQDLERLAEQTADADEIRAAIRKACEEIAG